MVAQELDEFFDDIHAMAIVITDLESSTAQAQADRAAYKLVQDIHDTIFRECLSAYNGYEINTEGDSFHCAFADVPSAVVFCLEVQQRLLESKWPPSVLRLPACNRVRVIGCVFFLSVLCGVWCVGCCVWKHQNAMRRGGTYIPDERMDMTMFVKVESQHGQLIFNGPRVRMGIHYAQQGTIGIRYAAACLMHRSHARGTGNTC